MSETARWALPLLDAGQAQKEMTVNEALARVDLLAQPGVAAVGRDAPPTDPASGQAWIVGAAPTGAWAGQAHTLAGWTAGGWRFVAPREGLTVWSDADGCPATFAGGTWRIGSLAAQRLEIGGVQVVGAQTAAIAVPTGGGTIDAEARAVLGAVLAALRTHGLIGAA
ncbi:DUF2793 domain-containing protein [uncultured Sphingomonas sp.]|uniref:DUF2793 domain-containing protein n=1 Tax=uncultured Sphingomonas sp. TaxID=158754 RepID=UPI0035CB2D02